MTLLQEDEGNLLYRRDKSGREVDFIIRQARGQANAIECKINPDGFEPANLSVFRSFNPEGRNIVISPHVQAAFQRRYGNLIVEFTPLRHILETPVEKQIPGLG